MATYEVARSMAGAPAEVRRVAVERATRWLPTGTVRAVGDELEWRAGGLTGRVVATPDPSGGSDVVLRATGEPEGDGADERVRAELADALLRLADEVGTGARQAAQGDQSQPG